MWLISPQLIPAPFVVLAAASSADLEAHCPAFETAMTVYTYSVMFKVLRGWILPAAACRPWISLQHKHHVRSRQSFCLWPNICRTNGRLQMVQNAASRLLTSYSRMTRLTPTISYLQYIGFPLGFILRLVFPPRSPAGPRVQLWRSFSSDLYSQVSADAF